MKSTFTKRMLLALATITTLGSAELKAATPSAPKKEPAKSAHVDTHSNDRESFANNYKALNFDFEGDFPAIYWDHGNVAGPGGVKLDTKKTITVRKITSLEGDRIPVKSYKAKEKKYMAQMADGILPAAYKGKFKIELVKLNLGTLNKSNIPDFGDNSFTNTVYYVPSTPRQQYHDQAIQDHLKVAEDLFGADRFYNFPLARQVVIVDMIYPLRNNFKDSKFGKAVMATDWDGPNADEPNLTNKQVAMREAWASLMERGTVDKDGNPVGIPPRRWAARRYLLDKGTSSLLPQSVPSVQTIAESLPVGETKLAGYIHNVLSATATNNQERAIKATVFSTQRGLKK